jgi:hypothetical protein
MRMLCQNQFSFFNDKLKSFLIDIGLRCGLLIELTDNIITNLVDGKNYADIYFLATLSSSNSGAVNTMAKILDKMDFSLLFHKGKGVNIHFKLFPRIANLYFRK